MTAVVVPPAMATGITHHIGTCAEMAARLD